MKHLTAKAEYIIKSDLIKMVEAFLSELKKDDDTVIFEVNSNLGGKMEIDIKTEELPDLRKKITQP